MGERLAGGLEGEKEAGKGTVGAFRREEEEIVRCTLQVLVGPLLVH